MEANKLTIHLTHDQQNHIRKETGRNITELTIDIAATGSLTEEELAEISGGEALHNGTHIPKAIIE